MGKITKITKTSFISFYKSKEVKHKSIEEYREFSVGKILQDFFISIFSKEDSKLILKKHAFLTREEVKRFSNTLLSFLEIPRGLLVQVAHL